jgi:hypothetical protein
MLDGEEFAAPYWLRVRAITPKVTRDVLDDDRDVGLREAVLDHVEGDDPAIRADVELLAERVITRIEERESR